MGRKKINMVAAGIFETQAEAAAYRRYARGIKSKETYASTEEERSAHHRYHTYHRQRRAAKKKAIANTPTTFVTVLKDLKISYRKVYDAFDEAEESFNKVEAMIRCLGTLRGERVDEEPTDAP